MISQPSKRNPRRRGVSTGVTAIGDRTPNSRVLQFMKYRMAEVKRNVPHSGPLLKRHVI